MALIREFSKKKIITKKVYSSTFGDILLRPTLIYVKTIQKFINKFDIKGIAHITGGGIAENLLEFCQKMLEQKFF